MKNNMTLIQYFYQWIVTFKKPAISRVTYIKYENTLKHIDHYFGEVKLTNITRLDYQTVINEFAKTHAKRTTTGFHKQIRAAILDALEDGFVEQDFTRKIIITGREKVKEKVQFHSYFEWKTLIKYTETQPLNSYNFIIFLSAMTGLRFSEVLGLTLENIDFKRKQITINKTWDYKYNTGFKSTKNDGSIRTIDVDKRTINTIKSVIQYRKINSKHQKICIDEQYKLPVSSTINRYLEKICSKLDLPIISFHGLRHTHASILLFKGVNILSVSKRLGHKDVTTTQAVYLHVIKEMEEKETKLIMSIMLDGLSD